MELHSETLIILDFGSQYTQLIARRARELGVFSLILPSTTPAHVLKKYKPKGIVLSGGPGSVYARTALNCDEAVFQLGLPVLGVCYGFQLMAKLLGGQVAEAPKREYGITTILRIEDSLLLNKLPAKSVVWMSHGDHITHLPKGFVITAKSGNSICAIEDAKRNYFGLQFHPEVSHTKCGSEIIRSFLIDICHFKADWSSRSFIENEVEKVKRKVGSRRVICALSGGVDSSVAATLVDRAIGKQQICIFIDTGLLRKNEYSQVLAMYRRIGLNVKPIRAVRRFLSRLKGVVDPEQKRRLIGQEFITIFEEEALKLDNVEYLVQGTLYPDVIESIPVHGSSATIKSHHNVGGLPDKMKLKLIEPLRELFKDEVRKVGGELGLPDECTCRQPFPGPGLAIRIVGEVDSFGIKILQEADSVITSEIEKAGLEKELWQYFAVLLPINSVGVMGDNRTYEQVVAIRVVDSVDGMTANWSKLSHGVLEKIASRVISEVRGVNRVVYDITSKPPGTIEWE